MANGQTENDKPQFSKDSALSTYYFPTKKDKSIPCYEINGITYDKMLLQVLDPESIKSIEIGKDSLTIDGKTYYGKVIIQLKPEYKANFITLETLINKHLSLEDCPVIIQVNGNVLETYDAEYMLDENYILKINVRKTNTLQPGLDVYLINLLTKTTENIEAANHPKIRIRGKST